jgi:hypothetical protein
MIAGIGEAERLTTAVTGTNTAYEQAAIIMESPLEKNKRLQASVDDLKISLFNGTNGFIGYANVIGDISRDFANLIPIISGGGQAIAFLTNTTKMQALWAGIVSTATSIWTGVQTAFNVVMAMNPIFLVVAGVIALIAAIAWVVSKTEGWGKAWKHTVNGAKLLFQAFVDVSKAQFNTVVNGIMIGINKIQIAWYKFKNMAGLGDKKANNAEIKRLNEEVETRKESIKAGYKKAATTTISAAMEFKAAYGSVKWKKEGAKITEDGITAPGVPGVNPSSNGGGGSIETEGKGKKANEAVASGGTKHNYITINIKELNGMKDVSVSNKDAANKAGSEVADELLRVLAMASTATG